MIRFIRNHKVLASDPAAWDVRDAIDAQIVQKILPKLHGSRALFEPLIWGLAEFTFRDIPDSELDAKVIALMNKRDTQLDPLQLDKNGSPEKDPMTARFPLSFTKLCRMAERVKEGFVSFMEA